MNAPCAIGLGLLRLYHKAVQRQGPSGGETEWAAWASHRYDCSACSHSDIPLERTEIVSEAEQKARQTLAVKAGYCCMGILMILVCLFILGLAAYGLTRYWAFTFGGFIV